MNIRTPRSGKAAKLAKAYLKSQGFNVSHQQALELVARFYGYASYQAMASDGAFADPMALEAESSYDYVLRKKEASVWITVDNVSVYVRRNDEGVSVDLYPKGEEMNDSLAGTFVTYEEATPEPGDEPAPESNGNQASDA